MCCCECLGLFERVCLHLALPESACWHVSRLLRTLNRCRLWLISSYSLLQAQKRIAQQTKKDASSALKSTETGIVDQVSFNGLSRMLRSAKLEVWAVFLPLCSLVHALFGSLVVLR